MIKVNPVTHEVTIDNQGILFRLIVQAALRGLSVQFMRHRKGHDVIVTNFMAEQYVFPSPDYGDGLEAACEAAIEFIYPMPLVDGIAWMVNSLGEEGAEAVLGPDAKMKAIQDMAEEWAVWCSPVQDPSRSLKEWTIEQDTYREAGRALLSILKSDGK
jgi:hypothetical protein